MFDKSRFPLAGSYDVGYGKPPKDKRFKKGQSGNLRGRPKGAKNKTPATLERLKSILVSEAYREVEIQDKTGPASIPVVQAAMRSLAVKAAKGNIGAQKLLLSSLSEVEDEEKRERLRAFDNAKAYQKKMRSIIQECRYRGEEPPEMLPHPDDIELDLQTGEVIFHGPVSPEDMTIWLNLHHHKEVQEKEIDSLKFQIKSLEERDIDVLGGGNFEAASSVDDYVATLKTDLEFAQFILITTCLSIMRRWSLPGKEITDKFALRRLLDQHIANGTNPKKPRQLKSKPINWEKMYKASG